MKKQVLSEFESYGVKLVSSDPKDPKEGQNLIYIDDSNLQKMAGDPDYRAQVFSVIQAELVSTKGYSFQQNGETVSSRLTGTVISISNKNDKSRGDVPYSGMCTGVSVHTGSSSSDNNVNKSKSMLEIIKERHDKRLEKKKAEGKPETARIGQKEASGVMQDDSKTAASLIDKERIAPYSSSGGILDVFC